MTESQLTPLRSFMLAPPPISAPRDTLLAAAFLEGAGFILEGQRLGPADWQELVDKTEATEAGRAR